MSHNINLSRKNETRLQREIERDTTSPVASDVNGSFSEVSPGVLGFNTFTEDVDLHMQSLSYV